MTYHLEGVELLLDLLRQHRGQPIACGDIAPTVVLRGSPDVVELHFGVPGYVSHSLPLREASCAASGISVCQKEVILEALRNV